MTNSQPETASELSAVAHIEGELTQADVQQIMTIDRVRILETQVGALMAKVEALEARG